MSNSVRSDDDSRASAREELFAAVKSSIQAPQSGGWKAVAHDTEPVSTPVPDVPSGGSGSGRGGLSWADPSFDDDEPLTPFYVPSDEEPSSPCYTPRETTFPSVPAAFRPKLEQIRLLIDVMGQQELSSEEVDDAFTALTRLVDELPSRQHTVVARDEPIRPTSTPARSRGGGGGGERRRKSQEQKMSGRDARKLRSLMKKHPFSEQKTVRMDLDQRLARLVATRKQRIEYHDIGVEAAIEQHPVDGELAQLYDGSFEPRLDVRNDRDKDQLVFKGSACAVDAAVLEYQKFVEYAERRCSDPDDEWKFATGSDRGGKRSQEICFAFRDHGHCKFGDRCHRRHNRR